MLRPSAGYHPDHSTMYPPWIPRNLQKRLLLYILQQLQLFSEIDLPNLEEVSLNNIHLRNVAIDPEKMRRIPGCSLRYGKVSDIELTGGVGGVHVGISDVDIVVVPNLDDLEKQLKQALLLLAQSTVELAQSIMTTDEPDTDATAGHTQPRRNSALGGMMSKAVEIALSKLTVEAKNIKVKLVLEAADVSVHIESLSFSAQGPRKVHVGKVRVLSLKLKVNPGHGMERAGTATPSSTEDDSGDDSLMDSMMFTHEEASSIYMSATSMSAPAVAQKRTDEIALTTIDDLTFSFEGLSPISEIAVEVHRVAIALVPLLPAASVVALSISKLLKLKKHQVKRSNITRQAKFPQYDVESDLPEEPAPDLLDCLKKVHVAEVEVSLTSALSKDGDFVSREDDLSIFIENINLKHKDESLLFGGAERFSVTRYVGGTPSTVMLFSQEEAANEKADVRFGIFKRPSRETTVLLSKPATMSLDLLCLQYVINCANGIGTVVENVSSMIADFSQLKHLQNPHDPDIAQESESKMIFQLSSFDIEVVGDGASLSATVFPLTFDSTDNKLSTQRVNVYSCVGGEKILCFTFPTINFNFDSEPFKFHYMNGTSTTPLIGSGVSRCNLKVGKITGSSEYSRVIEIGKLVATLVTALEGRYELVNNMDMLSKDIMKSPHSSLIGLANSIYSSLRRYRLKAKLLPTFTEARTKASSFRGLMTLLKFTIKEVTPKFGDIEINLGQVDVSTLDHLYASIQSFKVSRIANGHEQPVLYELTSADRNLPIVLLNHKSGENASTNIVLRRFCWEYYTAWHELFERSGLKDETPHKGSVGIAEPEALKRESFKKSELRVSMYDFIVGLSPGRLKSKLGLVVSKGISDFTYGAEQCYVKSSFKEVYLNLTDDTKNLTNPAHYPNSCHQFLTSMGYLQFGFINSFHVGVTVNTKVHEIKARHERLGIKGDLSLIDLKINSDEHTIEVCADSTHTLLQTMNDLKPPLVFQSADKYKLELESFTLPNDILNELLQMSQNETLDTDYCMIEAESNNEEDEAMAGSTLNFAESHFDHEANTTQLSVVPFSLNVHLSTVNIYLFDGYDWKLTRKSLRGAFKRMEEKASMKSDRASKASALETQPQEIEETLFNSIFLSISTNDNANDIVKNINAQLNPLPEEEVGQMQTGEEVTINIKSEKLFKNLKPNRSKHHKILATLINTEINVTNFTTRDPRFEKTSPEMNMEEVNKVEVRLDTITVFDNVPTSTWNKMLTYMSILGEREVGTSMLHFSVLNVRPDPNLVFAEAVVHAQMLPVRLHIDQDTLEFLTRFLGFKDSRFDLPVDEIIFFQKVVVDPIKVKFDYKPKKVDYQGIRTGHHGEFANFFILDGSDISLQQTKVFGVLGFPGLGSALGRVYGPYIQKHQLASILYGLAPLRSIANLSGGVKDLVVIPVREYKKDGRLLRSLQKGTSVFAKTTTYELLKLGIKLASGAQVLLENSEEYFGGEGTAARRHKSKPHNNTAEKEMDPYTSRKLYMNSDIDIGEDLDIDLQNSILILDRSEHKDTDDEREIEKLTSLYSNQPQNLKEGIKDAYKSLGKNLGSTKKTIVSLGGELQGAQSMQEQIALVARLGPIIVIRPMIGTTEAMMKALMGLSNDIDPKYIVETFDKYRNEKEE